MPDLTVQCFSGASIAPHLDAVAALRIAVFRDWPYLYDGDAAYEATYLAAYAQSDRSVFVLACDGGRVIGASTGIPLADDADAFQQPFRARGIAPGDVFYFGESVLLPEYRGRGLGHRFFDEREVHAREAGYRITAFCAVDRDPADPRRPPGHRDNDAFWRGRGYLPQPDMQCRLRWREVGDDADSEHTLTYWLRRWV